MLEKYKENRTSRKCALVPIEFCYLQTREGVHLKVEAAAIA